MYTERIARMPMKEFRQKVKASMPLPVIVQSDGQDAFAAVPVAVFRGLLDKDEAQEGRSAVPVSPAARWYPPDLARDT